MIQYVTDKTLIAEMRQLGNHLLRILSHNLNKKYDIGTVYSLSGSSRKKLITRNGNDPPELDYHLNITRCKDYYDCMTIERSVIDAFTKILRERHLGYCYGWASAITTREIWIDKENQVGFKINIMIFFEKPDGTLNRLFHEKNVFPKLDRCYWVQTPHSQDIRKKADFIKENNRWEEVCEQFISLKNRYLNCDDHTHPSFVCYIEAVNNVYHAIEQDHAEKSTFDIIEM